MVICVNKLDLFIFFDCILAAQLFVLAQRSINERWGGTDSVHRFVPIDASSCMRGAEKQRQCNMVIHLF